MLFRPTDENGDMRPITRRSQLLFGANAVSAAIRSRLNLQQGEWWEDTTVGSPIVNSIISGRKTANSAPAIAHLITAYIVGTRNVAGIQNVKVSYLPATRSMAYSCLVIASNGNAIPLEVNTGELL